MFIRAVQKKDKNKTKTYTYYRLTYSYRIGNKTRQIVVLNLGKLEGVNKSKLKLLANRIEEIVSGIQSLFVDPSYADIEDLAQNFASQISRDKIFPSSRGKVISKEVKNRYDNIDLQSIEQLESKGIGGEWLVKQAFDKLNITEILRKVGLNDKQIIAAKLQLTAKLLHPSSELETLRWLNENSGASDLYDKSVPLTRYKLYQATTKMYDKKQEFDDLLYGKLGELFPKRSKIVIYDLTNMYFEGQMNGSKKAAFGRSKQKRSDRKLIGLALSIDALGFVRNSQFYKGNISEPGTFLDLIKSLADQLGGPGEKPLIVMDAGISTEDNLEMLRSEPYQYDYVCVSRSIPKEYQTLSSQAKTIQDNIGNEIHLSKISVEDKDDFFLHIKSDQKKLKEQSIKDKLTSRLEEQLLDIKQKLSKKRTIKKIEKIHEKVGAIKAKLSRVGYLYDITYTEDSKKGIVTDLNWKRIRTREKPKGEYFLRYTKSAIEEEKIWNLYNMTRDIEAVFRCLKTDLDIRPVYHQKDKYIEPHIWLGIVSYQIVNYIRKELNNVGITYSWTTIVNKMSSMQSSINVMTNDKNQRLYIKLCTKPTMDQRKIFDALNFKHRPFTRKIKVVT